MPCIAPLRAWHGKVVSKNGKRPLVFNGREAFARDKPFDVPCGQCVECRLDYARQNAIRLMKEAQCHDVSSFVTITYDQENLPVGGTLVKRDASLFHKRLHNRLLRERGYGIRYYCSGEYGETYGRPHYHSIIFGFDFPDKKFYKYNARGEPIFQSEYLRDLWPVGRNGIGNVTFDSCAYTAGYVTDKISKGHDAASEKRFEDKYGRYDDNGNFYLLEREFSVSSRRPGIGRPWFDKFKDETYRDDGLVVSGKFVRPPRYFDNLFAEVDSDRLDELKDIRRRSARGLTGRQSYAREKIVKARLALRRKDVS